MVHWKYERKIFNANFQLESAHKSNRSGLILWDFFRLVLRLALCRVQPEFGAVRGRGADVSVGVHRADRNGPLGVAPAMPRHRNAVLRRGGRSNWTAQQQALVVRTRHGEPSIRPNAIARLTPCLPILDDEAQLPLKMVSNF